MDASRSAGLMLVISAFGGGHRDQVHVRVQDPTTKMTTTTCVQDLAEPCPVCMETISSGQRMSMPSACLGTGTMHAFHEACLSPWMQKNDTCPKCRR